ncbi:MAG: NAD(P)/FAD-dependent oxidoreductase [Candidatus Aenigmatarchaeota archaeon]
MAKVLVLGAGFGGVNVALEVARSRHDVEIIDIDGYHEYTPGLIDLYRERMTEEDLRFNLNRLFRGTGVEFSREAVEDIDPERKSVETSAGTHDYDYLVVSLGSEPRSFGMDLEHADAPYTLKEARESRRNMEGADKVNVVGSGYVGVEVAGELAEMGKNVTVIESSTRPMSSSNEAASHKVLSYLNDTGIDFRGGSRVKRIESGKAVLENGKNIEHDECVWAAGIQASKTVQESLGATPEGLEVDGTLRWTKYPDVFAVGDCAGTEAIDTAHNAMRQAEVVSENIGKMKSDMKTYQASKYPLIVSLGDTGLVTYGETALKNSALRSCKDLVFHWYRSTLKKKKLKAKHL